MRRVVAAASAVVVSAITTAAWGDEPSPWNVHYGRDGAVFGALLAGNLLLSEAKVDTSRRWQHEILPWDHSVRGRRFAAAAERSDMLGTVAAVGPVFAVAGTGLDESAAHRGVIYANTLGFTLLITRVAKVVVQRPRPYVYGLDPGPVGGRSSHLSFFSGHSSMTFAAAVAGSYLYGVQSPDEHARAALWGVELALASATANLRVRAGKHFYSDIVMGALVGAGIGATLPRLYLDQPNRYAPTTLEVSAMGAGIVGGTAAAWLLPLPEKAGEGTESVATQIVPVPHPGGGSLVAVGQF